MNIRTSQCQADRIDISKIRCPATLSKCSLTPYFDARSASHKRYNRDETDTGGLPPRHLARGNRARSNSAASKMYPTPAIWSRSDQEDKLALTPQKALTEFSCRKKIGCVCTRARSRTTWTCGLRWFEGGMERWLCYRPIWDTAPSKKQSDTLI